MMGRTREIANNRLPYEPRYSPQPYVVEPADLILNVQDVFQSPTDKYLLGLNRNFVVQVGVGDQAQAVKCYAIDRRQKDEERLPDPQTPPGEEEEEALEEEMAPDNVPLTASSAGKGAKYLHPGAEYYHYRVCETQLSALRRPPTGYTLCHYPGVNATRTDATAECIFRTLGAFHVPVVGGALHKDTDRFLIASSSLVPDFVLKAPLFYRAVRIPDAIDSHLQPLHLNENDASLRDQAVFEAVRDGPTAQARPPPTPFAQFCDLAKDKFACMHEALKQRTAAAKSVHQGLKRDRNV